MQNITTMSTYNSEYPFAVAFPPQPMTNVLAEWLAKHDVKQAHVAGNVSPLLYALNFLNDGVSEETEKYAHVTFFFNGGVEKQFSGEERHMVPSPKVATYDKDPKMNAHGVADKVADILKRGEDHFVMCNFAPPDMVNALWYNSITTLLQLSSFS
jgi:2,3-bisphosphoglycerate-independent phosphoglycerate mutase